MTDFFTGKKLAYYCWDSYMSIKILSRHLICTISEKKLDF